MICGLEIALPIAGLTAVMSSPPAKFSPGCPLAYRAAAVVKRGPVTFAPAGAPEGMTVTAESEVRWDVPADFAAARVDAILSARDAGGREAFQALTLAAAK